MNNQTVKKLLPLLLILCLFFSACDLELSGGDGGEYGDGAGVSGGAQSGDISGGVESGDVSGGVQDAETSGGARAERGTAAAPDWHVSASPAQIRNAHDLSTVPPFSDSPFVPVNDNIPGFTDGDLTGISFEIYSELDALGRCGEAYANVGTDLMPTEARGSIGQVKPSGWSSAKYDIVDGKYLYNRCHLIGYQLTAENANRQNLITGTRYLNVKGMLPFENLVADYVKETENHVLYRVTPIFEGENLVASGVQMEAMSVEDSGEGVLFNVYCYNVQPGIVIDYATGESREASDADSAVDVAYVLNTNTRKFHLPTCSLADRISGAYRQDYTGSREELIAQGYEACQRCKP